MNPGFETPTAPTSPEGDQVPTMADLDQIEMRLDDVDRALAELDNQGN